MENRVRRLETIRTGEVEIVTCIDGAGPTLVMLPSYGRDGLADFNRVADRLAGAGWRVLRPQPRGAAGSRGPTNGLDLVDLAADVAGVVRQVGGEPVVVLGHAFGNVVARVMAVELPDLVRGVILAAASASPKHVAPEVNQTPFIAGDPTRPDDERLAALRLAFFAEGHDPHPWLTGWYPETLAMQQRAVHATKLEPYQSAGSKPILEIIPCLDPFEPRESWSELRDQVGDRATTVIIDDAAHALFPEQPDLVVDTVRRWAAKL